MKHLNKSIIEKEQNELHLPSLPDMVVFYAIKIDSSKIDSDLILLESPFLITIFRLNKNEIQRLSFFTERYDYYRPSKSGERATMNCKDQGYTKDTLLSFKSVIIDFKNITHKGFFSIDDLEKCYNPCVDKINELKFKNAPNSIKYIVEKE